jgi:formylglycine-generating enzyme required for sulfatase activity
MRSEITSRYRLGNAVSIENFERFDAVDLNTKAEVYFFQPDMSVRVDPKRLALMNKNIQATFQSLDPVRFVKPQNFYPITEDDPCFYFVEERAEGTLEKIIEETDLSVGTASAILVQVLDAVAELHRDGLLHNNLTAAAINVRTRTGQPQVRIGGLYFLQPASDLSFFPYNPAFGAPELQLGDRTKIDASTDVYAIGMMAYMMYLGRRGREEAFSRLQRSAGAAIDPMAWEALHRIQSPRLKRIDEIIPEFPKRLATLIEKMLLKPKEGRFKTAGEALDELKAALAAIGPTSSWDMPVRTQSVTQPEKPPSASRKLKWPQIGVGVAAFVVLMGVWLALLPGGPDAAMRERWDKAVDRQNTLYVVNRASTLEPNSPGRMAMDRLSEAGKRVHAASESRNSAEFEAAIQIMELEAKKAEEAIQGKLRSLDAQLTSVSAKREAARAAGGDGSAEVAEAAALFESARKNLADMRAMSNRKFADLRRENPNVARPAEDADPSYLVIQRSLDEAGRRFDGIVSRVAEGRAAADKAKIEADLLRSGSARLLDASSRTVRDAAVLLSNADRVLASGDWAQATTLYRQGSERLAQEFRRRFDRDHKLATAAAAALKERGAERLSHDGEGRKAYDGFVARVAEAAETASKGSLVDAIDDTTEAEGLRKAAETALGEARAAVEAALRAASAARAAADDLGARHLPQGGELERAFQAAHQRAQAGPFDAAGAALSAYVSQADQLASGLAAEKEAVLQTRKRAAEALDALVAMAGGALPGLDGLNAAIGAGDEAIGNANWAAARTALNAALQRAGELKKAAEQLEAQARGVRSAVEPALKELAGMGADRLPLTAGEMQEAEKAMAAGDAALAARRLGDALSQYQASQAALERARAAFGNAKARIESVQVRVREARAAAEAVGLAETPAWRRAAADISAADGHASSGRVDEALASYEAAVAGLATAVRDVAAAEPEARAARQGLAAKRTGALAFKPEGRGDFRQVEDDFASAESDMERKAFRRAIQKYAALAPVYDRWRKELDRMNCAVPNGPANMLGVAVGVYELGPLGGGPSYRNTVARRIGETPTLTIGTEYCIQVDQVSQAEYLKFLNAQDPSRRAQFEAGLSGLTDSRRPVTGLSYEQALKYAEWLSGVTGKTFQIPSAEEWIAGLLAANASGDPKLRAAFGGQGRDWVDRACDALMRFTMGNTDTSFDLKGECRMQSTVGYQGQSMRLVLRRSD